MLWLIICIILGATIAFAYAAWRNWIAPWRQIEQLVRQITGGDRPRTFLVDGGKDAQRVGLALENLFTRQQELDQQISKNASGSGTIFGVMQDAILVVDAKLRVTLLNRAFRELFEIRDDSLGAPLIELVRDANIEEILAETFREREARRREMTVANRQMEMNAVPMTNDHDEITGAAVLFHDITELKRTDRMRRDFVANVSHELRTPLSILGGYIETLLDNPKVSREELANALEVMERHSKRLGLLVDDLLTLAQLESGNSKLQMSDVDLAKLLAGVVRDWQKKFAKKQLKVIVDLAKPVPLIRADETRLREVLDNLLDNAVKYSPENGEIRLQVERHGEEVVLGVSDNGIGIGKGDLQRIFERFYRADKARSRELGGTGLGLSIVKHIAQLHRGRVEAESELGRGTTIRVVLPVVTQT